MWVDEEQQQQQQRSSSSSSSSSSSKVVLPGEPLHIGEGFLLGLNTYVDNGVPRASVCGVVQTVNRLVYVRALKSRYEANVGDVVIGRVTDIANGKWYLDVGAARLAVLSVAAVCLDVQRRRDDADVLIMRSMFQSADLLCCEVQKAQVAVKP
ncbi:exosome complex exonuclease, putative [Eimeria acervulina]|uniref:Exosome complex exonuclease, putative n=1 Tax=Eimeria acervulina TaxID=5801 RepID=U6GCS2_EIMAC|nr:exosome complex exonuclease, putative [Eimeria acervulina]CDI78031.1 exosome complex exonuclease, putative [Eimeria acervulina]